MSETRKYEIILKPVVSEKTTIGQSEGKYTFKVATNANKIEIKKAIKELFNVTVTKVNILNMKPKKRRMGRYEGYKTAWKKAIVTLKQGDSISIMQ